MKQLILTSLLATGLSFSAMASEPAKPAPAANPVVEAKMEKKEEDKNHAVTSKSTKEEKLAHRVKEVEDLAAKLTEELKTLTGAEKANAELALAHAKLELDASKNENLKLHASSHIFRAKNFLKKVSSKHHKK